MYDGDPQQFHYEKSVSIPGDYRSGIRESYDCDLVGLGVSDSIKGVVSEWAEDPDRIPLMVIRGGSGSSRTALASTALPDEFRYWTEYTYHENFRQLDHYRTMAEKLSGSQDVLDQYHEYERKIKHLEACPFLFVDCVGESGYWPNQIVGLVYLVENRQRAGLPTVLCMNEEALDRVPAWNRLLDVGETVWIS